MEQVVSMDSTEVSSYIERLVGDGGEALARVFNESAAMKKSPGGL